MILSYYLALSYILYTVLSPLWEPSLSFEPPENHKMSNAIPNLHCLKNYPWAICIFLNSFLFLSWSKSMPLYFCFIALSINTKINATSIVYILIVIACERTTGCNIRAIVAPKVNKEFKLTFSKLCRFICIHLIAKPNVLPNT